MNISALAKAILLPVLMLPITASKANEKEETKDRVIPAERILFPEIDPISASTLALPRSLDPMSLGLLGLSRKFDRKNYISEIIVNKDRFQEDQKEKYDAFYKVDTENKGWFYIVRDREGRTSNLFRAAFDGDEKKNKLIFLEPTNEKTPVTTINAKELGLNGVFEIYDENGWYYVQYKFLPILTTPDHTNVSSDFMINVERELEKLPGKLVKELTKQGVEVIIAHDVEDAYYHYYPSWKERDESLPADQTRPPYEITSNGYRDNRKYANVGGMYIDGKVIIPQRYITYGTNKEFDYVSSSQHTKRVLYHELGHALDYVYSSPFSDSDGFKTVHKFDIKSFSDKDKKDLVYFYVSRSETFAHLTAALLGGLSKDEAGKMLSKFPKCAEHIRQDVLPRFDIELSKEQIRRDIYPDYLKEKAVKQTRLIVDAPTLYTMIIPPDMPQETISARRS